jgi:hypothetical protein
MIPAAIDGGTKPFTALRAIEPPSSLVRRTGVPIVFVGTE